MATIVIDPGHGGTSAEGGSSANNATGPAGTQEKNLTLEIALMVKAALDGQGHTILMTRDTDTNFGLAVRAKVAADNDAEAFLSIHFNGNNNPSVQGSETWVHSAATNDSVLLARQVQQRLVNATGYNNRGVKRANFGVVNPVNHDITTAACLAEISFITNAADETRLLTDFAYKNSLAGALAQALLDYVNGSSGVVLSPETLANHSPESGDPANQ